MSNVCQIAWHVDLSTRLDSAQVMIVYLGSRAHEHFVLYFLYNVEIRCVDEVSAVPRLIDMRILIFSNETRGPKAMFGF
jgi:hypothetical protein